MGMEELTNFGMKSSLTFPSLANKCFNSLSDENDEPIYAYTDPFIKKFARDSSKSGRCNAFTQHCKSELSDEVFNIFSRNLNIIRNICKLLETYSEFLNKNEKLYAKEFVSKYEDYKDINQQEKKHFILTINLTWYQFMKSCQN